MKELIWAREQGSQAVRLNRVLNSQVQGLGNRLVSSGHHKAMAGKAAAGLWPVQLLFRGEFAGGVVQPVC